MITIRLTFSPGCYYASPWGINPTRLREAELPLSPWNLLRALVSAWFRVHPGQAPSPGCIAPIESLGRELPQIGFSKISFGHTVHWQPNYWAAGEGKPEVVKLRRQNAEYKNTRHKNHFAAIHGPSFSADPSWKSPRHNTASLEPYFVKSPTSALPNLSAMLNSPTPSQGKKPAGASPPTDEKSPPFAARSFVPIPRTSNGPSCGSAEKTSKSTTKTTHRRTSLTPSFLLICSPTARLGSPTKCPKAGRRNGWCAPKNRFAPSPP